MIIDIHSHLGKMTNWPEAEIHDYLYTMERENVDISFLFPLPYQLSFDGLERVILKYKLDGDKPVFSSDVLESLQNPYAIVNEHYYNVIRNCRTENKELMFVPILHPILDSPDYLRTMILKYDPPALKLHGTGSGIVPSDISEEIIKIFRDSDLPLIIHTDFSRTNDQNYIDKTNSALNWAKWAVKNNVRICLAHGARLQPEALDLVNRSEILRVGIAPVQRVSRNINRLEAELSNYTPYEYLCYLRDNVDPCKIFFDLDYNWNRLPGSNTPDYSSSELVEKVFSEYKEYIFYQNALAFFHKIKAKSRFTFPCSDESD